MAGGHPVLRPASSNSSGPENRGRFASRNRLPRFRVATLAFDPRQRLESRACCSRRRLLSGVCAAAALAPAVLWLAPALLPGGRPVLSGPGRLLLSRSSSTRPIACARARSRSGIPCRGRESPGSPTDSRASSIRRRFLFLLSSPALAGGALSAAALRHRGLGRAALPEGGERLRRGRALRRGGLRRVGIRRLALGLLEPLRRLGVPAGDRGAGARSGLRSRASMLGLGALVGLQAMAGSPEISAATVVLAGALAWSPRDEFPEPLVAGGRARRGLRRFAAGVGLGLALAAWVHRSDGGARRALGPSPRVRRRGAGRGRPDRWRDARHDVGIHARLVRRRVPRVALPAARSSWSPRPRRFGEDHRRRLALRARRVCAALGVVLAASRPARRVAAGSCRRSTGSATRRSGSRGRSFGAGRARGPRVRRAAILAGRRPASARSSAWRAVAALGAAALAPLSRPVRLCCGVGAARARACWLSAWARRPLAGALLGARGRGGPGGRARPRRCSPCRASRPRRELRRCPGGGGRRCPRIRGPRRHAADGRALGLGSSRRSLRRRDARAPARGAARLHEPAVPRADGAHRGAAADRRRGRDRGRDRRGRGRAAGRRRERARALDAVSARRGCPRARSATSSARRSRPTGRGCRSCAGYRVEPDARPRVGARRGGRGGPDARGPPRPAPRARSGRRARSTRCCSRASSRTRPNASSRS